MQTKILKDVLIPLIILLSILGVADTIYLTQSHFTETPVFCTTGSECEFVLTSEYSEFMGIPVALFGFLYYLVILILAFIFLKKEDEKYMRWLAKISPIGFLASVYFVYLQIFVLHALCTYCMVSAVLSTLIFMIGMFYLYSTIRTIHSKGNNVV